jgi:hypothetical protein
MTRYEGSADERWFVSRLDRELDGRIIATDPRAVAATAMSRERHAGMSLPLAGVTIAFAVVVAIVGTQFLSLRPTETRGSAGNASTASPLSKGPLPDNAWNEDGTLNWAVIPDFISVTNGDAIGGWVRATDVLPTDGSFPLPDVVAVYGDDLTTLVGHMYPDVGFVPLGSDPAKAGSSPAPRAVSSAAP